MRNVSFFLGFTVCVSTSAVIVACSDDTTTPAVTAADASSDASTSADGASSSTDGGGDGQAGPSEFCAAKQARDAKCGNPTGNDTCAKDKACYESGMRPGVAAGLEACIVERACGVSDDTCFASAAKPFENEPNVVSFVSDCTTKRNACEAAGGGSFSDDYCSPVIGLFPSATVDAAKSCLALGCTEVRDCFNSKTAAAGCPK